MRMKIEPSKEIIDFIETNGDVVKEGEIKYIHLPQWIIINEDTGIMEIGMPEDILDVYLKESILIFMKRRFKSYIDRLEIN